MKTVVLYETAPETAMGKMMEVFQSIKKMKKKFVKAGKSWEWSVCNFWGDGAMAILQTKNLPKEFAKRSFEPKVLVSKVTIKEWHDELM